MPSGRALASLAAADEMRCRVAEVTAERARVVTSLRAAGWSAPEPQGNFVWLPVGARAAGLAVALEHQGVVTRAFADVGVRVTISDRAANDRFLTAIESIAPDGAEQ